MLRLRLMKKRFFSIKRETMFQGPRKIGLDSDCIIRTLTNPILYAVYQEELSKTGLIHIHEKSLKEVPKVLERDYKLSKEEAEKKLKEFIEKKGVKIVPKIIGNPLLPIMKAECRRRGIKFHPPDSWIIADFKRFGINKVYSGNKHFLEACRLFGIDATEIPSVDKRIKQEFRRLYRK